MENKLDKLFRDHLSKHEEIPSAGAWNQLQDQLIKRRRVVWGKKLAVAASILLIAAVGIVQYQSLVSLDLNNSQVVTKSGEFLMKSKDQNIQNSTENIEDKTETTEEIESATSKELKDSDVKEIVPKNGDEVQVAPEQHSADIKEKSPLVAEVQIEEHEIQEVVEAEAQSSLITEEVITENSPEILVAENTVIREKEEEAIIPQKNALPSVKITYKATANSALVTSEKKNILDKGIHKIAEFSNDHLLTADRKSKLRNTKEELLALNFSKILTKTDKEFEN